MKRLVTAAALLLALAAALGGCGGSSTGGPTGAQDQAPEATASGGDASGGAPATAGSDGEPAGDAAGLTVGLLPIVDALPFWVAQEKGYFAEAGVEVELVTFKSADERDIALTAGQIDGEVSDTVAATTLVARGLKVKIVSLSLGAAPAEGRFAILVPPDSEIESIADLKGVPVAISKNSIIHYVTDKLLEEAGLASAEIATTAIPQIPVRFQALMSGQVAAACLPDPLAALAEFEGARVLADDSRIGKNLSQSVLLFSEEAIAEKGAAIQKMLTAYNRAVADINAAPDSFRPLLVERARLPEPIQDTYPVDPFSPAQLPTKEQLQPVSDWLVAKGVIDAPVAYEALVDGSLLP